ncbi:aspartate/methionine/tyrosine aminotransferase [Rubricella aquisinus]|uniref:aspartate transaminase n=1 Tax=Rubricella aquisinus TaxID=2028108 RepID=A0A840X238_9RHOB|nr:aminotransferase [Rubricella aquisinus]MBB5514737.1 aspartate/methionine/tyrosine aminotransferase [Rubricella aquisinus]
MTLPLNPHLAATFSPPVMEARRWLAEAVIPADRPLLNLSQAAPVDPPHPDLRRAMAAVMLNEDAAHIYGPVLGLPDLRDELARKWAAEYGGVIGAENVAITSGCNQAFCTVIQTLAQAGDAVVLATPWYFNHKMWLDMAGIETRLLTPDAQMMPDPDQLDALMDDRVKALILITPNNPTGVAYPDALMQAFRDKARAHGIALIVDETYRDFHVQSGAPHSLFADPDWDETLIHLYSFSKVFRLTGHRVGALVTSPQMISQVEKVLDTVTVCANQIGQRAALYGLRHLGSWVAAERDKIHRRHAAVRAMFDGLEGWDVVGSGAYFAYVTHPFDLPSDQVAQAMMRDQSILTLPGTMFGPTVADGGDGAAERQLRIAFANADMDGIAELGRRLARFRP